MSSEKKAFGSCFISAPFGANLHNLPRVLDRLNIHWEWAKSTITHSERLPGDLRKLIRGVDFVVGVLFGGAADSNTMFEVGVAVGAGKPVLLLVADHAEVPLNLQGLPQVRVPLTDTEAIELHLDLLRRSVRSGFRYPSSGPSARKAAPVSLEPEKRIQLDHPGSAFEAQIAKVIEEAGGRVQLHPRPENVEGAKFTPDLLFWLPSRDVEMLNPAVVEAKGQELTAAQLRETEDKLFSFLQQTGVRTGLIISGRAVPQNAVSGVRPLLNIFILDFEQFRELLENGQLADHLRRERNRAVHGLR